MSGTTQAFRNALHIPFADPSAGQVVQTVLPGDAYTVAWAAGAAGSSFPNPDAQGQVLVSGPGPGFVWTLSLLDCGTF